MASQNSPFLPFSIPLPLEKGNPSKEYPWRWSVYNWLEGNNPLVGQVPESLVHDLILFIGMLRKIELPNGPLCNRGVPLEEKDLKTRKAIQQLEGIIDVHRVTALWQRALKAP